MRLVIDMDYNDNSYVPPGYGTNITASGTMGGVYCGMCGRKMYHDAEHDMWRCPYCHDGR